MQMSGDPDLSDCISLYFHIPFCTKKCAYCHFYVIPDNEDHKEMLLAAFVRELEIYRPLLEGKKIATVYFGGGTPSLFGPHRIEHILNILRRTYSFASPNTEITLEANPEDITLSLMQAYQNTGINRVSIGIQTLNDNLLHFLGRLHNSQKAIDAVHITSRAGIQNITIDLMYELPHQTLAIWKETLQRVADLPITHLSLYNLTIEPHTVFFKHRNEISKALPDEVISLQMYELAIEELKNAGLMQYEISAFAKPGMYSRHNTGYWTGRHFIGLGPSAFSYWDGRRFRNVANLNRYTRALEEGRSPIDFDEKLDPASRRKELLVIKLRLLEGVDLEEFEKRQGKLEGETHQILSELIAKGWLTEEKKRLKLTRKGILFYDSVATELI